MSFATSQPESWRVASLTTANNHASAAQPSAQRTANYINTRDGVQLYYKDWGPRNGAVVTFSHGWPLSADSWESQMIFLAEAGYRVVAHDRRGHGRSSQPWEGNDMDHYADDLATVIDTRAGRVPRYAAPISMSCCARRSTGI